MNKIITKKSLENLIEPHFKKDLISENYEIKTIKASKLLVYARFDLAFKLLYLEMKDKNIKFSKKTYAEHIRAFSLGKFTEPGNKEKNSIFKFEKEFHNIFEDIKYNGFDYTKTLIPLSNENFALNGAHRISSAIYLKKEVDCIVLNRNSDIYDYKYFYNRNISSDMLDVAAIKFVEYANNVYIAFLWPIEKKEKRSIETIISNIVYKKKIQLNSNGAHNLLSQIYYGEEWLGSIEDNFRGSQGKLIECFKTFNSFEVVAFQADSLEEVLKIKENIRTIFNVGKHSIHITDTKEEAIRTAKIVFNDNSIHFLNYAKPNRYLSTHKKIDTIKQFIKNNNIDFNDIILDGGIILSSYGLRESGDVEYFTVDSRKIIYNDKEKLEMIFNPKYHFYFNDIKFISFIQLYKMKRNRAKENDKNDCKMMESLIENNKLQEFINRYKQNIYYERIKMIHKILKLLKLLKLYYFIRITYRLIKRKK